MRATRIIAAIDNSGNIKLNTLGAYIKSEHEEKYAPASTVVEINGDIPLDSDDVYSDYILIPDDDEYYKFELKPAEDRWHIEISGDGTIPADGTSSSVYTIKKVDADGADYTIGTEQLTLELQRGSLDVLTLDLVAGSGTVTLTSVAETVMSGIVVKLGGVIVATKQVSFVPVN